MIDIGLIEGVDIYFWNEWWSNETLVSSPLVWQRMLHVYSS